MKWYSALLMICIWALPVPAGAGQESAQCHLKSDFRGAIGQEGARAAVGRGDAAPFEKILKEARPRIQGEIMGQLLEQHRGVWLYEFRVLAPDGHIKYLHFDAKTGRYVELTAASCAS